MHTNKKQVAVGSFTCEVRDNEHIESIVRALKNLSGVISVTRKRLPKSIADHFNYGGK